MAVLHIENRKIKKGSKILQINYVIATNNVINDH